MKLQERAMLARLHITRWTAMRTDMKVTRQIAKQHAVKEKRAGHYKKHAIDIEAPTFRAVVSAGAELRHRHYFWTLPWGDDGARILPAAHFEKYSTEQRKLRADFYTKVEAFIADYVNLIEAARRELNGLFDENDYPKDIGKKFGVELAIRPLPDEADFRVKLPDGAIDDIRIGIRHELEAATAAAMREPFERLYEHIQRMVERLSDPEGIFRDTLVTGLAELCGLLPGLNLTGDKKLEQLRKRAEQLIAGIDAETLRTSPTQRAEVAKRALQIQNDMAAFMGVKP